MKKIILLLSVFFTLAASAQTIDSTHEKEYTLKLNDAKIKMLYQTLEVSRSATMSSQIPMIDGVQNIKNIDSLQEILRKTYQNQADTTKKK